MLDLPGHSRSKQFDSLTKFKLFKSSNIAIPLDSIPQGSKTTSRSRKRYRANDGVNENHSYYNTPNTVDRLPSLLVNKALAQAVSQVQMQMGEWEPLHILKLFVVLVQPPLGLDLSAISGLGDYLTQLMVQIGNLTENGMQDIVRRCWCALQGKCSTLNIPWG